MSNFGLENTVENLQLNPQAFAKQYASSVVRAGWTSVAIAVLCLVVAVAEVVLRKRRGGEGGGSEGVRHGGA